MAIAITHKLSNGSTTNASPYDVASTTFTAGRLYLLVVENCDNGGSTPTPTVTGLTSSKAWTAGTSLGWDTSTAKRMTVFRAVYGSTTTEQVRIAIGSGAPAGCLWTLYEVTGCVTSGTDGGDAIRNPTTNTGSGTTGSTSQPAFAASQNGTFATFGHKANEASSLGTGFGQLGTTNINNPAMGLGAEARNDNDTTPDMTWTTSSSWAGISFELIAVVDGTASPGAASISVTMPAASVSGSSSVTAPVASIPVSLPAPTASSPVDGTATPPAISAPATLPSPTVTGGGTASPPAASTPATLPAPSASGEGNASTPVVNAPTTLPAPTSSGGGGASPAAIAVPVTMDAPTGSGTAVGSPPAAAIPVTMPAPGSSGGATAGPPSIPVPVDLPAPTATGEQFGDATAHPPAIEVGVSLPAPAGSGDAQTGAPAALVPAQLPLPTATGGATAVPASIPVPVDLPGPSAAGEAVGAAPVASVVVSVPAPGVSGGAKALPGAAQVGVQLPLPLATGGGEVEGSGSCTFEILTSGRGGKAGDTGSPLGRQDFVIQFPVRVRPPTPGRGHAEIRVESRGRGSVIHSRELRAVVRIETSGRGVRIGSGTGRMVGTVRTRGVGEVLHPRERREEDELLTLAGLLMG